MNSITKDNRNLDVEASRHAQTLMGQFAWPTVIIAVLFFSGFILTYAGIITGNLPLWAGYVLASVLTYASYTILHDSVHGAISGKTRSMAWLNNLLGYLAGQIMLVSFKAHQKEHLAHHRHTNHPDDDPDMFVPDDRPWSLIRGTLIVLPLQYKYYFKHCWSLASARDKIIILVELICMIGWRTALFVFGFWQIGLISLAATFTGVFALVVLFVWIVHRPHGNQARYQNTNTFVFPRYMDDFITWLWLFQNYHSIHHLFPKVPFYRYRTLFRKIEPIMKEKDAPIIRVLGA